MADQRVAGSAGEQVGRLVAKRTADPGGKDAALEAERKAKEEPEHKARLTAREEAGGKGRKRPNSRQRTWPATENGEKMVQHTKSC